MQRVFILRPVWLQTSRAQCHHVDRQGEDISKKGPLALWSSGLRSPWRKWAQQCPEDCLTRGLLWRRRQTSPGATGWGNMGSRMLATSPATLGAANQRKHCSQGTDGQKLTDGSNLKVGSGPMVAQSPELVLCQGEESL